MNSISLRFRLLPAVYVLYIAAIFVPVVLAQDKRPPHEPLNTTGILKGAANGRLVVATENAGMWQVTLPNSHEKVSYSASADLEYLKPGMMLRFNATITNKGLVVSEISALTVFTPVEKGDVGIKPAAEMGPSGADALFADPKDAKKPPKAPEQMACIVAGELVSLKGKKMLVSAGGVSLKCELAENAKVDVFVHDLRLAQPGDKVNLRAWFYTNNKTQRYGRRNASGLPS